ncbi:MAG: hypothetical protein HDT30_13115 [Clostridiales bacterium]|nr:hypothetical protein [Clostridiales bacterium]
MLFVEVQVPIFDQVYDFKVEQNERVYKVLLDIIRKICQKEGFYIEEKQEKLFLWDMEQKRILPKDWTMEECGIKTGTKLLLV